MYAALQRPTRRSVTGGESISSALESTIAQFLGMIRDVAMQHSLDDSDQDEVVQDVRIRLWRSLSTREKINGAPASYVYRTAVSAALDLIRRRRARREQPVETLAGGGKESKCRTPDRELVDAELANLIEDVLKTLHESRRPVVRMHLLGYHRTEIAELLGWTEAKTRNLLYRGLGDLREQLTARGITPEAAL